MNYRLFLLPLTVLALGCSDGGTGPNLSTGGTGGPGGTGGIATSGDTNVAQLGFVTKSVVVDGVSYGYQVFVPANYNSVSKVPVVVYMHGGGESGSDNVSQVRIGLGETVRAQASTFPALVVFPQSPFGEGKWTIFNKIVPAAINQSMKQYGRADSTRIYLTGWSYGGLHGFDVAYNAVLHNAPNRFAAFVPMGAVICGACFDGQSSSATPLDGAKLVSQTLKTLPIWQFQGSKDKDVTPAYIADQVAWLTNTDPNYKYTELNVDHQITGAVYDSYPAMWTWLWAQHR